jgi:hypothetical protein
MGIFHKQIILKFTETKAAPVTDRGGLWGCMLLRISHHLDNSLTDGADVITLTVRLQSTP